MPFNSFMTIAPRRVLVCGITSTALIGSISLRAAADITAVGGSLVLSDPPASILLGQWESNTEIRGWFERETTLANDITLGHVATGWVSDLSQLQNGTVAAGTTVQSYMVRTDPIDSSDVVVTGLITFDTEILGVYIGNQLGSTDAFLGRLGITYNQNSFRGLELDDATSELDAFEITADRRSLFFAHDVSTWTDDIRIITAAPCRSVEEDIDCNGTVGFSDLVLILSSWGPCDSCPADVDNDGVVGLADLIQILSSWSE